MDDIEKDVDPVKVEDSNALEVPNQPIALDDHMNEEQALETQSKYFSYFVLLTVVGIIAYLVFHNKKKVEPCLCPWVQLQGFFFLFQILALVLEGRRRNQQGRGRRSSSSAQYRKLDNNLEEAMGSNSDDSLRHVIY